MESSFPTPNDNNNYQNDYYLDNVSEVETTSHEKKFWSENEDRCLEKLVEQFKEIYGMKHNWAEIAKNLPGRSREQCRKRWRYKLDPQMKHDKWTNEEDDILLKLHSTLGNKWAKIGKIINGRSDVEVKNHFYALQRKVKNEEEMMRCLEKVAQKPITVPITEQPLYLPNTTETGAINYPYPNYPEFALQQCAPSSFMMKSPGGMNTYFESMDSCRPSGLVIHKVPTSAYPVTITESSNNDHSNTPMFNNRIMPNNQLNFQHRPPSLYFKGPIDTNMNNGGGNKRKIDQLDGSLMTMNRLSHA